MRYLRDGDLPQFVRVMDVETGEEQVVSKNRLQLPLPGVEHESKSGDDHTKGRRPGLKRWAFVRAEEKRRQRVALLSPGGWLFWVVRTSQESDCSRVGSEVMPHRVLRPPRSSSERWNRCQPMAQSLFIRLLTLVDDYSRFS